MKIIVKAILKLSTVFICGGIIYYLIEDIWRTMRNHGDTHWFMFVFGGLMLVLIGLLNEHKSFNPPIWLQGVFGGIIITGSELLSGVVLHKCFNMRLWDYTGMFMNYKGYIQIQFSLGWILISVAAIFLDDFIRWSLFHEPFPQYKLK